MNASIDSKEKEIASLRSLIVRLRAENASLREEVNTYSGAVVDLFSALEKTIKMLRPM